jgi:hypothetical protein
MNQLPYIMKRLSLIVTAAALICSLGGCSSDELDFSQYPSLEISNEDVQMKIYLPDAEKGLYRATRFDWAGVIGSVRYQGHEYFGYWKRTHDPLFHEDLTGPVEGYIAPGPGYEEAEPGGHFIRIGVGVLEKPDEQEYNWRETYKITDHGTWEIDHGEDWITFTQELNSDIGYAYIYEKTIKLKKDGFFIGHRLFNTGAKPIETDQFNHNFFMIDGQAPGPSFTISFPYPISTTDNPLGMLELDGQEIHFLRELVDEDAVFVTISGYSDRVEDHEVTVLNRQSGAGVTFREDKPLHRMAFWACATTLSPENSVWISVEPGKEEIWTSEYTLFVQ